MTFKASVLQQVPVLGTYACQQQLIQPFFLPTWGTFSGWDVHRSGSEAFFWPHFVPGSHGFPNPPTFSLFGSFLSIFSGGQSDYLLLELVPPSRLVHSIVSTLVPDLHNPFVARLYLRWAIAYLWWRTAFIWCWWPVSSLGWQAHVKRGRCRSNGEGSQPLFLEPVPTRNNCLPDPTGVSGRAAVRGVRGALRVRV